MAGRSGLSVARLSGSGRYPQKMLIVGDQAYVDSAREERRTVESLSTAIVDSHRGSTDRGIDLDMIWDLAPAIRAIGASSAAWRLWRYDAVIVVVGPAPGARGVRLRRLLLAVIAELARTSRLVLVLTAPAGEALRETTRRFAEELRPEDREIPAVAARVDDGGRLLDAVATAATVLKLLAEQDVADDAAAERDPGAEEDGAREAAALRSLAEIGGVTTDLQRVVLLARNSFDVPYAQLNLVSRGRLHTLAFAGRTSDQLENTLSEMVIRSPGALLIPDTRADPRYAAIDEIHGDDGIRFFAGYPIESIDGFRIGVLCVFDTAPHDVVVDDDVLLRDVALLAEAEINALTARERPRRQGRRVADSG